MLAHPVAEARRKNCRETTLREGVNASRVVSRLPGLHQSQRTHVRIYSWALQFLQESRGVVAHFDAMVLCLWPKSSGQSKPGDDQREPANGRHGSQPSPTSYPRSGALSRSKRNLRIEHLGNPHHPSGQGVSATESFHRPAFLFASRTNATD